METIQFLIDRLGRKTKNAQAYITARRDYLQMAGSRASGNPEALASAMEAGLIQTERGQYIENPYSSYSDNRRIKEVADRVGTVVYRLPMELRKIGDYAVFSSLFYNTDSTPDDDSPVSANLFYELEKQLHEWEADAPVLAFGKHLERSNYAFFNAVLNYTGLAIALGPEDYAYVTTGDEQMETEIHRDMLMPVTIGAQIAELFDGPVQNDIDLIQRMRTVFPATNDPVAGSLNEHLIKFHLQYSMPRSAMVRLAGKALGEGDVTKVEYKTAYARTVGNKTRSCPAARMTANILGAYGDMISASPSSQMADIASAYQSTILDYLKVREIKTTRESQPE